MKGPLRTWAGGAFVMASSVVLIPEATAGQALWTEASTLGYGFVARGAAWHACRSCDVDAGGALVLNAGTTGFVLGARIGGRAEGAARRGEALSPATLRGACVGLVTGFAAVGFAVAADAVESRLEAHEGKNNGPVVTWAVAGGVAGILLEILYERSLRPGGGGIVRRIYVGGGRGGGVKVRLLTQMPW